MFVRDFSLLPLSFADLQVLLEGTTCTGRIHPTPRSLNGDSHRGLQHLSLKLLLHHNLRVPRLAMLHTPRRHMVRSRLAQQTPPIHECGGCDITNIRSMLRPRYPYAEASPVQDEDKGDTDYPYSLDLQVPMSSLMHMRIPSHTHLSDTMASLRPRNQATTSGMRHPIPTPAHRRNRRRPMSI